MGQTSPTAVPVRPRLDSVDWLRGFVMVVMALDHVRDFFGDVIVRRHRPAPDDGPTFLYPLGHAFLRPTFIFLTGVGIYLTGVRGRTKAQLAWLLLSRGAWLLVLELTYIRFFWSRFDVAYEFTPLGVFWSISWCMILMSADRLSAGLADHRAGTRHDPRPQRASTGSAPLTAGRGAGFGHSCTGRATWTSAWTKFGTAYKIIPWVGVMMAGYGFGRVLLWEPERRQRFIVGLGLAMIAAFVVLRGINVYGDRRPRVTEPDPQAVADVMKVRQRADAAAAALHSEPTVAADDVRRAVVSQLRKVSAVARLLADDARPGVVAIGRRGPAAGGAWAESL